MALWPVTCARVAHNLIMAHQGGDEQDGWKRHRLLREFALIKYLQLSSAMARSVPAFLIRMSV